MDIVQEWVPSEAETPADHWSKSPEYLAEKAKEVHPGQGFIAASTVNTGNRLQPTHEIQMEAFKVAYVKTEADVMADIDQIRKEYLDNNEKLFEQMAIDMITNIERALKEKDADLSS